MTADYSQIEMRIMAHLSRDEGLIEAFNTGEDLHSFVASRAFSVPIDEVTAELRRRVKAMSYGLAYGLSAYGLAAQLKISTEEAKEQMEQYFDRFGGVRDYLRDVVDQARKDGYTSTVFGRRRYLPELDSSNRNVREAAERAALNAPIQGSAADIIKVAMIDVDKALKDAGLKSRMLLQVHDELAVRGRRRRARAGRGAGARQDGRRLPAGRAAGGVGRLRPQLGRRGALASPASRPRISGAPALQRSGPARLQPALRIDRRTRLLVQQARSPRWSPKPRSMRSRTKASSDHLGGELLDRLGRPAFPPSRVASRDRQLAVRIEPSQVASLGVTRPAATMPGSLSATIRCSWRRLATPSQIDQPEDRHHPEHVHPEVRPRRRAATSRSTGRA